MSIDRFILRKLGTCQEANTTFNLLKLFQIRVLKAQAEEEQRIRHA
ncbi:hypothetical protein JJQ72_09385 [Paenibacillus sp. F411]|uniref:Uncharacterized protein n=1 Tax=Paenibacillus algicola TaxID=2565926 RepID=A0A4P8XKZ2_9BACL|nr:MULTISPECIES: hypothetical protein [Paenibacillus]MBO2944178.1 hypothetical protein [Paenibacillus sp. F411]QCT03108.1 hypothetical protein E6C60_2396 [Paenibacillus algicola]